MPKVIEIARSFSQTVQYKQFEPISIFASYKGELDGSEDGNTIREYSEYLYRLSKEDVLKSMKLTLEDLKKLEPPF